MSVFRRPEQCDDTFAWTLEQPPRGLPCTVRCALPTGHDGQHMAHINRLLPPFEWVGGRHRIPGGRDGR